MAAPCTALTTTTAAASTTTTEAVADGLARSTAGPGRRRRKYGIDEVAGAAREAEEGHGQDGGAKGEDPGAVLAGLAAGVVGEPLQLPDDPLHRNDELPAVGQEVAPGLGRAAGLRRRRGEADDVQTELVPVHDGQDHVQVDGLCAVVLDEHEQEVPHPQELALGLGPLRLALVEQPRNEERLVHQGEVLLLLPQPPRVAKQLLVGPYPPAAHGRPPHRRSHTNPDPAPGFRIRQ